MLDRDPYLSSMEYIFGATLPPPPPPTAPTALSIAALGWSLASVLLTVAVVRLRKRQRREGAGGRVVRGTREWARVRMARAGAGGRSAAQVAGA